MPSLHHSEVAKLYAQYRPHYPPSLAAALAERCERRDVAWDAGCGNGQLSVSLADHFARVIATDPSHEQIAIAVAEPGSATASSVTRGEAHARVEYRCEPAEASTLGDARVDLACAAQAAHWFDWPRYVAEVGRVARPGALVALVSYGILELDGEVGELVARYYKDVSPYWPPGREHVENGYRDLAWPWQAVEAPRIAMAEHWLRDELCGYVATWSATARAIKALGPARYDALRGELARCWPDGERREVRWPLAIRLARR